MGTLIDTLKREGLCNAVYYKEMYISEDRMKGIKHFLSWDLLYQLSQFMSQSICNVALVNVECPWSRSHGQSFDSLVFVDIHS